jgi:hypothetical protein
MNITTQYDNFIGIYDGAFSIDFCDKLIEYFKWCQHNNRTYTRPDDETFKKDESCNLNPTTNEINFSYQNLQHLLQEFNYGFWDVCYKDYTNNYSELNKYQDRTIYSYKIQRTLPAGGYHIWHSEDGDKSYSSRIGVYILYLNDVMEGGETEFLYLSKRIAPKKGRLIIFPPNYPWTHRGNPPLSGEKYIMTGWIEFR